MSDFCFAVLTHITTVGECLVNIRFAERCKLALFTFLKILIGLKNGSLFHAQTGSLSMQFCICKKKHQNGNKIILFSIN